VKPAHGGYYALLTVASGVAVLFGPQPLAVTGGLLLALVLPGLAAGEALLRGRKLARVERVVLAPALSLAVLVLAGLVVYGAGFPLEKIAWTSATVGVTLAGLIAATVPKSWTAAIARLAATLIDEEPTEPEPLADAGAAASGAAASGAAASGAAASGAAAPRGGALLLADAPAAAPGSTAVAATATGAAPEVTAVTLRPDITAATVAPDATAIIRTPDLTTTGSAPNTTTAPDATAIIRTPELTTTDSAPDTTVAAVVARPGGGAAGDGTPPRGLDDTVVLPVFVPDRQARTKAAEPDGKPAERAAARPPRRLVWQAAPLVLVAALLGTASWLSYTSSTKSYATTVTALSAGAPGPVNATGRRSVAVRVTGLVTADGPYHLVVSGSTGSTVLRRTIDVAGVDTWSQSLELPARARVTVNLYRSGDSAAYRTLYLSPVE
jgi:hypothetical protein